MNFAFDVSNMTNIEMANASLIAGPAANSSKFRDDLPAEFYKQAIITCVSTTDFLPSESTTDTVSYDAGT